MALRVCLAGATGWAGSALARAIAQADDLALVAGVSRTHAGKNLGEVLGISGLDVTISASADDALTQGCDVFVEYTKPDVAKQNVFAAVRKGANVVIGTSGLTEEDFAEIGALATEHKVGVLAVGNFAIANAMLQKCAEMVAKHIPHWEIIDYADDKKIDAPSGTTRELSYRLAKIRTPSHRIPVDEIHGPKESRGVTMNGMQIHSIRLPGYVISAEIIFGQPDQKLSIRYEAGSTAEPYVEGAMMSIRKVGTFTGLKRGLDSIMDF